MPDPARPRCRACPVPAHVACPDQPWHCRRVARGGPGVAAEVRRLAGLDPPADAAGPAPIDARLYMLADVCPHGSGPCGCGAEPRHCSRPGRPPLTFRPACLDCVAADVAAGILTA